MAGSACPAWATEGNRATAEDHSCGDREASRHFTNQGDCDPERRSSACIERSSDPHSCLPGLSREDLGGQIRRRGVSGRLGENGSAPRRLPGRTASGGGPVTPHAFSFPALSMDQFRRGRPETSRPSRICRHRFAPSPLCRYPAACHPCRKDVSVRVDEDAHAGGSCHSACRTAGSGRSRRMESGQVGYDGRGSTGRTAGTSRTAARTPQGRDRECRYRAPHNRRPRFPRYLRPRSQSGGLIRVAVMPTEKNPSEVVFQDLQKALIEQHGAPASSQSTRDGLVLRQVVKWDFPTTSAELTHTFSPAIRRLRNPAALRTEGRPGEPATTCRHERCRFVELDRFSTHGRAYRTGAN